MKGTTKYKNVFSHLFSFSCSGYCPDLFGAVVFVPSEEKVSVNGIVSLFSSTVWFHVASVIPTELFSIHARFFSPKHNALILSPEVMPLILTKHNDFLVTTNLMFECKMVNN